MNKKILNFLNIKEHPAKKHIDRKLIFRIRMFYVIGILLTGLMLYEVFDGFIGIELALGGFFLGLFLGFISTRMFIIHWHDEKAKVVARFDTIGIFVMLLYVAFSASRTWLFGIPGVIEQARILFNANLPMTVSVPSPVLCSRPA